MRFLPDMSRITLIVSLATLLAACDNGGGSSSGGASGGATPAAISAFELLDPTPGAGDQFGQLVVILSNGNIVVSDPNDSSIAANNGAVHLYNPITQMLIASIYGDDANDQVGLGSITALSNGNFVLAAPVDNLPGAAGAGTVRLINGVNGAQIGSTIAGDNPADGMGFIVTALANDNFVIAAPFDDLPGLADAGSVRLVDGTTGLEIPGSLMTGNDASDGLGFGGITALSNDNFVIASPFDTVSGVLFAGSVRLVDGTGGTQIGTAIAGDNLADSIGISGAIALSNGNYVIGSPSDDEGAVNNGSVRLVDGNLGTQIGMEIVGDGGDDGLGFVTALTNSNYVIGAPFDDVGGPTIINGGSVRLVSGATGIEIIGGLIEGDTVNDQLGLGDTIALANNNFVFASFIDDVGAVEDAGSVRLINGTTGLEIGLTAGDDANDQLGFSITGVTALANSNFVISADLDDVGLTDNGSVRLVDGATGIPIVGGTIAGSTLNDQLGSGGVTALANNDYVIVSPLDDEGGIDFGSVRLIDGVTGIQIGASITGAVADDMNLATVTGSPDGDYYILGQSFADKNAMVDSGLVRLITL